MTEFNDKQAAFVGYAAEVLEATDSKDLDGKLQGLSNTELEQLVNSFEDVYNKKDTMTVAKLGAKLEYINSLNKKCPEGYELTKFAHGGIMKSVCKKCDGGKLNRPIPKGKKGSVITDFKKDIAMNKKGAAIPKKAANLKSAKTAKNVTGNYNESEHASLLSKYKNGKASDKEVGRLQELNRKSKHHDDGWMPKKQVGGNIIYTREKYNEGLHKNSPKGSYTVSESLQGVNGDNTNVTRVINHAPTNMNDTVYFDLNSNFTPEYQARLKKAFESKLRLSKTIPAASTGNTPEWQERAREQQNYLDRSRVNLRK